MPHARLRRAARAAGLAAAADLGLEAIYDHRPRAAAHRLPGGLPHRPAGARAPAAAPPRAAVHAAVASQVRTGPGQFESRPTPREIDNFPLVNVTHPDYERHPLFKDAHVMTIDVRAPTSAPRRATLFDVPHVRQVPAGSALVLPAYWYHQVESFAPPGGLNVAVNYWFQGCARRPA